MMNEDVGKLIIGLLLVGIFFFVVSSGYTQIGFADQNLVKIDLQKSYASEYSECVNSRWAACDFGYDQCIGLTPNNPECAKSLQRCNDGAHSACSDKSGSLFD